MPARLRWKPALLCLARVLLVACASSPQRAALGRVSVAPAAAQVAASQLAGLVPVLLVLLKSANAVNELDERLWWT